MLPSPRQSRRGPEKKSFGYNFPTTVAVAQLVESRIVIPVVVGSSPISHPIFFFLDTESKNANSLKKPHSQNKV